MILHQNHIKTKYIICLNCLKINLSLKTPKRHEKWAILKRKTTYFRWSFYVIPLVFYLAYHISLERERARLLESPYINIICDVIQTQDSVFPNRKFLKIAPSDWPTYFRPISASVLTESSRTLPLQTNRRPRSSKQQWRPAIAEQVS